MNTLCFYISLCLLLIVAESFGANIYSRQSGNWTDPASWSTTGLGGPSCGCVPGIGDDAVIGGSDIVTLDDDIDLLSLTISDTGTLLWGDEYELRFSGSGDMYIANGATLDKNGNSGAQLDFLTNGSSHSITIDGTFSLGDVEVSGSGTTLTFGPGTGTVDIAGDLEINEDDVTIINNHVGILKFGDDITFDKNGCTLINNEVLSLGGLLVDGSGNTGNSITNSAGAILNIADHIDLDDSPLELRNSGTINQQGDFKNVSGSDFHNLSGSIWNFLGDEFDTDLRLHAHYDANHFNYSRDGSQEIIVPQNGYWNVSFDNDGTKETTGDFRVQGDLTISGDAVLDITSNGDDIVVQGNWTNSSTNSEPFKVGTQKVTLLGTNTQAITTTRDESFFDLEISKSAGKVILNNNVVILTGGHVDFLDGIVESSSGSLVVFSEGSTSNGGNARSYVDGPIKKIGNDDFIFPTGDGHYWARIGITNLTNASSEFTAEYFDGSYEHLNSNGSMAIVSGMEYWDLHREVTNDQAMVHLFYEDGNRSDIHEASTDLVVAHFDQISMAWENAGHSGITGDTNAGCVASEMTSDFSPFTFASLSGTNTLPIELVSFEAKEMNGKVRLKWQTATEENNDFFTLERSKDGDYFVPFKTLPGAGNSDGLISYEAWDIYPLNDLSYYRLKQTDFNGEFSYSPIVSVRSDLTINEFVLYPNPSNGSRLFINSTYIAGVSAAEVVITDLGGKQVLRQQVQSDTNQLENIEILNRHKLDKGIYVVTLLGSNTQVSKKLIIN